MNDLQCPGCGISAPDGICDGCGRVLHVGPFLGLFLGAALLLAAVFVLWCVTS